MKTKIIFLLLIFVKQLFAINSNGFIANINGFSFQENVNYEINSNYLQAFSNISCGDGGSDNVTTILHSVDMKSGKFTCLKYLEGQTEPQKIEFKVDSNKLESEKKSLKNFIDNNIGTAGISFTGQLGSYVFPGKEISYATNYINTINISDLYNANKNLTEESKNNTPIDAFVDSHTEANKTFSNIMMGILTSNPDYLEEDAVSELGELRIKDYAIDNGVDKAIDGQADVIDNIVRFFLKEKNESKELSIYTLANFLDSDILGFYTYLMVNLEQVYNTIVWSLVLYGVGYIFLKAGLKKIRSKLSKEREDNTVETNVSSQTFTIGFLICVFFVPVSISSIKVPDKFIYEKANKTESVNLPGETEYYQNATIVKVAARYFANLGSTWANAVSDYALFSYLRFLESKQGFITQRQITQNDESIKKLFEEIFYLKKDFDFFQNVCKPAFSSYLDTYKRFNTISQEANESLINNLSLDSQKINKFLGIDRINPAVCQKLEKDIFENSRKILSDYSYLRQQLKISEAVLAENRGNIDEQKAGFGTFVNLIKFQQQHFGWVNSVIVPVTYNLFFQNSSAIFQKDVAREKIKESDDYNIISAWSKNEKEKEEIKNSIDDSLLFSFLGDIQSKFIYFILPGFQGIFEQIYQFLSNVAGLDPTAQQMSKQESTIAKAFLAAKYFLAAISGGPLGVLVVGIMSTLSSFGGFVLDTITATVQYALLLYISLMIAVFIMLQMIVTLVAIVIALATIIRIVIYYMEVILVILGTDIIIFFSLITNSKQKIDAFVGFSLITFILVPLTIVTASYLYIFISTLSVDLFLMLVGMVYDTSLVANESIISNSSSSFTNGLTAVMTALVAKSIGVIFAHLFSMLVGLYLIFKLKDKILHMMGINSEDSNLSRLTEGLQSRVTGDAVKI